LSYPRMREQGTGLEPATLVLDPLPVDPAMDGEDLAWSESLNLLTAASTSWATPARDAGRGTRTPT